MRALLVLLLLLFPLGVRAETVVVQSGEHAGYTRLALQLATPTDWVLGRAGAGYELRLKRSNVTLDISHIFDRIAKNRISSIDVVQAGTGLRLRLACNCHAIAFNDGSRVVVLDVRKGPPAATSPFEAHLPPPGRQHVDIGRIYDWRSNVPAVHLSRPGAPPQGHPEGGQVPLPPTAAGSVPPMASGHAFARPLTRMEKALAADLSRAASVGLLAGAKPLPSAGLRQSLNQPQGAAPPVAEGLLAPASPTDTAKRIIVRSPGSAGVGASTAKTASADPECLPDSLFAFGTDQPKGAPADRIAALRSHLVGEFDRPDVAAVTKLANLYLSLGFGAEARALPRGMGVALPDADLVDLLGRLEDGWPIPDPGRLRNQQGCHGAVALWALLARPVDAPAGQVNTAAILHTFFASTPILRRLLGERLAHRLLALGKPGAAHAVTDTLARIPGNPTQGMQLAQARVDLATGRGAQARDRLMQLTSTQGPDAPVAALLLVQAAFRGRGAVPGDLPATLAAWAKDYRGAPLAARLQAAIPLAFALSGAMDKAFAALPGHGTSDKGSLQTRDDVFTVLARRGTDEDLLRHGVSPDPAIAAKPREALARRVLALGFPGIALNWLGPPAGWSPAAALLAARARLALGDATGALQVLKAQTGSAAEALRQKARRMVEVATAASGPLPQAVGAEAAKLLQAAALPPVAATGGALAGGGGPSGNGVSAPSKGVLSTADRQLKEGERLRKAVAALLAAPGGTAPAGK